ncbi:hypothetical protein BLNAU_14590 [Blattamonas nauphoetae]|uniref:Uncharacterized protein n=1 Tax=Blattamonas nauphoetae TaxID=2049346 RepID=A0ABQ9XIL7_9EUKA|nr:hypothetical protein BLNAU_24228 [Blattamonas nauphoetae]KAK2950472.1 hypothetical protein BLNAU_14590 [Blattamonas nauphoetae]
MSIPLAQLWKTVSFPGIQFLFEQLSADRRAHPCRNITTTTMLMPCSHVLAEFVTNQQPIPLSIIHPAWRLYGREDKHIPFQQSGWDRRIGEGTRMVLLRDAKFPSDRSKGKQKGTARDTLRALTPWAEEVIKLSKRGKPTPKKKRAQQVTVVGGLIID